MASDSEAARKLAKDIQEQTIGANARLIGGRSPSTKVDRMVRDTGELLGRRLHERNPENYNTYGTGLGEMYELNEPSDPKNYGR